jgi:hypothetical protein
MKGYGGSMAMNRVVWFLTGLSLVLMFENCGQLQNSTDIAHENNQWTDLVSTDVPSDFQSSSTNIVNQLMPGGGGRMPGMAISPHNKNEIVVATDMGTLFMSTDGGESYRQLPSHHFGYINTGVLPLITKGQSHYTHVAQWHPTQPRRFFVSARLGFFTTGNKGAGFSAIRQFHNFRAGPYLYQFHHKGAHAVSFFTTEDGTSASSQYGMYESVDGGVNWSRVESVGLPSLNTALNNSLITGVAYDNSQSDGSLFLATANKVFYRHGSSNSNWRELSRTLPSYISIKFLSGYTIHGVGRSIYITTNKFPHLGKSVERIYRLRGNPTTTTYDWVELTPFLGLSDEAILGRVEVNQQDVSYAYMTYNDGAKGGHPGNTDRGDGGVLKTTNWGFAWTEILFTHADHRRFNMESVDWLSKNNWIWAQKPDNVVSAPTDKNWVLAGRSGVLKSVDGGGVWKSTTTQPMTAWGATPQGGIAVMGAWDYMVYGNTHAIAGNDYGAWISGSGGKSWKSIAHSQDVAMHNIYSIQRVRDTSIQTQWGNIWWAAGGTLHDIPTWRYTDKTGQGYLYYSTDAFGSIHRQVTQGLPQGVIRDLYIEPLSEQNYHMYAAIYGVGLYQSTNKGRNWSAMTTEGLNPWNNNIIQVGREPGIDGRLFAVFTVRRGSAASTSKGNVYFLENEGTSQAIWRAAFSDNDSLRYPTSLTIDPNNRNIMYASSWTVPFDRDTKPRWGGVWKSVNRGQTWTRIHNRGTYSVTVDPTDSTRLFASVFDLPLSEKVGPNTNFGLFESTDGGGSWRRIRNINVRAPLKLRIYGNQFYLTTFGNGILNFQCPQSRLINDRMVDCQQ